MLTVLSVIGTRPEAIKMAPVVSELARWGDRVRSLVCVTRQHREMLDQVLRLFDIRPDYDLDLLRADQGLSELTASLFTGFEPVVRAVRPDWVLAQGDTPTVLVATLVAFDHRIPFGHVEAGLRTGDLARHDAARRAMVMRGNPYGDGKAAARIVAALLEREDRLV